MPLSSINDFMKEIPDWSDEKLISERGRYLGMTEHVYAIDRELSKRLFVAVKGELEKLTREVSILSNSSDRMEKLTVGLKVFTVWLLVFAGIQIIIACAQTWKMFQPQNSSAISNIQVRHSRDQLQRKC
jgi:hypothetical protein